MGGQNIILVEILEWVGDVTFVVKNWMEKVGGGGANVKFSLWGGYGYFLELLIGMVHYLKLIFSF